MEALRKGKASFVQSDFLACRQEDFDAGDFPEVNWAPPKGQDDERREFENSLEIFRQGPDVYYAPLREKRRRSHSKK